MVLFIKLGISSKYLRIHCVLQSLLLGSEVVLGFSAWLLCWLALALVMPSLKYCV